MCATMLLIINFQAEEAAQRDADVSGLGLSPSVFLHHTVISRASVNLHISRGYTRPFYRGFWHIYHGKYLCGV